MKESRSKRRRKRKDTQAPTSKLACETCTQTLREKADKSKRHMYRTKLISSAFYHLCPPSHIHIPSCNEPIISRVRQAALVALAHDRIPILRYLVICVVTHALR